MPRKKSDQVISDILRVKNDNKRPYSPESVKFASSDIISITSGDSRGTQIMNSNSRQGLSRQK